MPRALARTAAALPADPDVKRAQARARTRRWRQRQRNGVTLLMVPVQSAATEDDLIAAGFLTLADADNPEAVRAAFVAFFAIALDMLHAGEVTRHASPRRDGVE